MIETLSYLKYGTQNLCKETWKMENVHKIDIKSQFIFSQMIVVMWYSAWQ